MENSDLAIVVASCDKYSDLWEPLFDLFFKHWPDCPFPVYLVANQKRFEHSKVTTLLSGEDRDWSSSIQQAVQGLPHRYFLFWIDDAFLVKKVDTQGLLRVLEDAIGRNFSFLRLRPNPKPAIWLNAYLGEIEENADYRVTLFATVWRSEVFHKILKSGESAWEFELEGTKRSCKMPRFLCTKKEAFAYIHGVERGIWIRPAALELERMGYRLDFLRRPIMGHRQNLMHSYRQLKSVVFHLIPSRYRGGTLRLIQRGYRVLGLRKSSA
ncbi:MAG: hypothetical protein MPW17_05655 [Candidatus Manganitrophus sp.]|nr:hypothetical protein [Candidatus Manganitrophus sp.]MDC4226489.1 hypothetical protein [Candidatus Manganitrophus sp.]WDT72320.1 MAG: hypothetical protein MPW17_05655 [Candidatus Manganitrophus sp.]WDT75438.1 MAG: hypothetical protein MPW16_19490 [Candidatus Manganitrophus sp.]